MTEYILGEVQHWRQVMFSFYSMFQKKLVGGKEDNGND